MTQHDTNMTSQDADMTHQDFGMTSSGHATVEEAAKLLDVSVDAVRKRIERGTLRSEKVGKTRYVFLDDVMTQQDADRTRQDFGPDFNGNRHDTDMTALVASLQDQIDTLKRELEDRKEEARRKDAILMTMAQRIPELEPASEPREVSETAPKGAEGAEVPIKEERRSWLHRFFFGP